MTSHSHKPYLKAPEVDRIRWHLVRLEKPACTSRERMMRLRLISEAALQAHEKEVQAMDSLKFPVSDPEITSSFGGVSE